MILRVAERRDSPRRLTSYLAFTVVRSARSLTAQDCFSLVAPVDRRSSTSSGTCTFDAAATAAVMSRGGSEGGSTIW